MIGRLALVATVTITLVAGLDKVNEKYQKEYVADKEYLQKQKTVLEILYHYNQPRLDEKLHKIGQNYDLKANINSYKNKEDVEYLLRHLDYGLLHHDAIYSVYYYPEETLSVYKVLYQAKDFDTFIKTALFLRNRINHDMFAYTFYLAVIHRPDTEYIQLPPLAELTPYLFFNAELLEAAHHYDYFAVQEKDQNKHQTYVIPYNYSGWYLNDDYDYNYENIINYLTEDIGWNEYYFYFRNEYPYLLNSKDFQLYNEYRGEEYLYGHRQILARYNLERLANGLGPIEHFDYHGKFYPGYYPSLTYPNGLRFPVRPWDSEFPKNKQHNIASVMNYERRIVDAVDSGYVLSKCGERVPIYTPEGLNILGNLVEGNADSVNTQFYGNVDRLIRNILGHNFAPSRYDQAYPSALEHYSTSLRDPAVYRLYFTLLHYVQKYEENQGPYKPEEIQFPEIKIQSVHVDKLVTYFDSYDTIISNGLAASNEEVAHSVLVKARQQRLNHQPFQVNITVNTKKAVKAAVKIFLGPKFDIHGKELDIAKYYNDYFYEIDNFIYDLEAGVNNIVREQVDFTKDNNESSDDFYHRVVKALETDEEFTYQKRIYGFPNRLLLPKGKPEGLPMQLIVHIAPVIGEPLFYKSRIFGESYLDNRSFGYPLNRPIIGHFLNAPNMHFEDVNIYHRQ